MTATLPARRRSLDFRRVLGFTYVGAAARRQSAKQMIIQQLDKPAGAVDDQYRRILEALHDRGQLTRDALAGLRRQRLQALLPGRGAHDVALDVDP